MEQPTLLARRPGARSDVDEIVDALAPGASYADGPVAVLLGFALAGVKHGWVRFDLTAGDMVHVGADPARTLADLGWRPLGIEVRQVRLRGRSGDRLRCDGRSANAHLDPGSVSGRLYERGGRTFLVLLP